MDEKIFYYSKENPDKQNIYIGAIRLNDDVLNDFVRLQEAKRIYVEAKQKFHNPFGINLSSLGGLSETEFEDIIEKAEKNFQDRLMKLKEILHDEKEVGRDNSQA